MNKVHYSSNTNEWYTPHDFYAVLDREFNFTLDVCATAENAKCSRYFTMETNGLVQDWEGVCFMNPPYSVGEQIKWVRKAFYEARSGAVPVVVCLLPARTDTKLCHNFVMKAAEVRFIKGRLKFGGEKDAAPFPSAIVVFKPGIHKTRYMVQEGAYSSYD